MERVVKLDKYNLKHPLSEKTNYITDKKVIIGSNIIEYDIKQANINILRAYNDISDFEYYNLMKADKQSREILIGRKIQIEKKMNPDKISLIAEHIREGIKIAKDNLLVRNNINTDEVVRIANDAIYVQRQFQLQNTTFDILNNGCDISFIIKGYFSSFIKLGRVSVFLRIESDENLIVDVKGINDELVPLHQPFLGFICNILFYLERTDINTTLSVYNEFYQNYINKELPIEYYREFNSDSDIRIDSHHRFYGSRFLDEKYKELVDINYNLLMLREIYAIILSLK